MTAAVALTNPDRCPRTQVYQRRTLKLYHYSCGEKNAIPVCIVYALVNKTTILDLDPKRSFIRSLLQQGLDVYLIDWQDPEETLTTPSLEDYIGDGIHRTMLWLQKRYEQKINVISICQGGAFSLIYTALYPEMVKNLVTLVTPVDFHADHLFPHLVRGWDTKKISSVYRYIPCDFMNVGFLQLKPFQLLLGKYMHAFEADRELFQRMEEWIYDTPALSSIAWEQFIRQGYQQNLLIKGKFRLGDKAVDLRQVKCPLLNITADHDHLVPPASSIALKEAVASEDYHHQSYPVGHIGMFVSSKVQKKLAAQIGQWFKERD